MDDKEGREDENRHWITAILERVVRLETKIEPLQMIVYGLVAIVMTGVIVALLAIVLRSHP